MSATVGQERFWIKLEADLLLVQLVTILAAAINSYRGTRLWNRLSSDARISPLLVFSKDYERIDTVLATLFFSFSLHLDTI